MSQAADIALVTQKDSQDDERPGASPAPATEPPSPSAKDDEAQSPETALDDPILDASAVERSISPGPDDASDPIAPLVRSEYRSEHVSAVDDLPVEEETYEAVGNAGYAAGAGPRISLPADVAHIGAQSAPTATNDGPEILPLETEPAPLSPAPEPASEAATPSFDQPEAPATTARPGWDSPPPMGNTPSWAWRDVEPDIITRQPTNELPAADLQPPEPQSEQISALDPPATVYEKQIEQPELTTASALDHGVAPLQPEPAAQEQPSAIATESISPSPAPKLEVPPPPPHVAYRAERATRIEPSWHPESAQSVFQDARPGDFAPAPVTEPTSSVDRYKDYGRLAVRYAGYAVAGYFAIVFVLILLYRFLNPPASSLMVVQALTGTDVQQQWVPLSEISPSLVRAVIVSEDWSFCEHYGIDIAAIEQAIEKSGDGIPRGASTISMQTTKNLFLWNAKSYIRKAVELPLTLMIELIWPKRRILEIYLNVAEWGPGIFGAEAAAQYHFNKPAARLGEREAALLAASLPNPMIRDAGDPGPRTARKASVVQSRMRNAGDAAQCVLGRR